MRSTIRTLSTLLTLSLVFVGATGCDDDDDNTGGVAVDADTTGGDLDVGAGGAGGEVDAGAGGEGGQVDAGAGGEGELDAGELDAGDELDAPEIVGEYVDGWDTPHLIGETNWTQGDDEFQSVHHYVEVDNEANYLLAQNDESNGFAAGLYSRFDWTFVGEELFYCQIAFEAETMELAREVVSDDSDPVNGGCNNFAWSVLNPIAE